MTMYTTKKIFEALLLGIMTVSFFALISVWNVRASKPNDAGSDTSTDRHIQFSKLTGIYRSTDTPNMRYKPCAYFSNLYNYSISVYETPLLCQITNQY